MSTPHIPFDAFEPINVLQNIPLDLYQALYEDHTEPTGLLASIQAFGLLHPTTTSLTTFSQRLAFSNARSELAATGIETVTGPSAAADFMLHSRQGEVTLMILAFLLECMRYEEVSEFANFLIASTPDTHVTIRPRPRQIKDFVKSIQWQVSGVSWWEEMEDARKAVGELNVMSSWDTGMVNGGRNEINTEVLAAFYQALCTITRCNGYCCVLEMEESLVLPYALATFLCGLRVCVVVDGEVIQGDTSPGEWQVRLERPVPKDESGEHGGIKVKLGRNIDDLQTLVKVSMLGQPRSNRVPLKGIGKVSTIGQGLSPLEAEELAVRAVCIVTRTLMNMEKTLFPLHEAGSEMGLAGQPKERYSCDCTPVQTRVTIEALALWWDCSEYDANTLFEKARESLMFSGNPVGWDEVDLGQKAGERISRCEAESEKHSWEQRWDAEPGPRNRFELTMLVKLLTLQVILISFLELKSLSKQGIRVRSNVHYFPSLERSINGTMLPELLGPSDILESWYLWFEGTGYRGIESNSVNAYSADGFVIYRSLLADLNLEPQACEKVVIQLGHFVYKNMRPQHIMTKYLSSTTDGPSGYKAVRTAPFKLISVDKTGKVDIFWKLAEIGNDLELSMELRIGNSVRIETSPCSIAMASWILSHGLPDLSCPHSSDDGELADGEEIEETSPGWCIQGPFDLEERKIFKLFRAYGNNLGQIACLMSATVPGSKGMLRTGGACLRCCLSVALEAKLDFLID